MGKEGPRGSNPKIGLRNNLDPERILANKEHLKKMREKPRGEIRDTTEMAVSQYKGDLPGATNYPSKGLFVASKFPCDGCMEKGDEVCPYKAPNGLCDFEFNRYKTYRAAFKGKTMREVMMANLGRTMAMSDFIWERAKRDKYNKIYQPIVNLQRTIADSIKEMRQYEEQKPITIEYKIVKELDMIREVTGQKVVTAEFEEIVDKGVDIDVGKFPKDKRPKRLVTGELISPEKD